MRVLSAFSAVLALTLAALGGPAGAQAREARSAPLVATVPLRPAPTFSVRAPLPVPPGAKVGYVWIDLEEAAPGRPPKRVEPLSTVDFLVAVKVGARSLPSKLYQMRPGEPGSMQVPVSLDGEGRDAVAIVVVRALNASLTGSKATTTPALTIPVAAGASAEAPVPYARRPDRVAQKTTLLWAFDPAKFSAKRGCEAVDCWDTGFHSNISRNNNEPVVYADAALFPETKPIFVDPATGDLVLQVGQFARPARSPRAADDQAPQPYWGSVARAVWMKAFDQKALTWEVTVKQPSAKGLWTGGWALPNNDSWPPEDDFFETYPGSNGWHPGLTTETLHPAGAPMLPHVTDLRLLLGDPSIDLETSYNTWTFQRRADYTTIWINGHEVADFPTRFLAPGTMNIMPSYPLFDVSIVAGARPDFSDPAALQMRLKSIKFWD